MVTVVDASGLWGSVPGGVVMIGMDVDRPTAAGLRVAS